VSKRPDTSRRIGVPPPKHNLQSARDKAVEALCGQQADQLEWLGASPAGNAWRLPVLDGAFRVNVTSGDIACEGGGTANPMWHVLALHYLNVRVRPDPREPEITFPGLPGGRAYAGVYEERVCRRLCRKVGGDRETLQAAATGIGARFVDGGDLAFEVSVFPRVPIRVIWYAADDELPAACTLLLTATIESFLCVEDIVVASEVLVSRLAGAPLAS